MTKEQIKEAYLKAVGNPESGVFIEMADEIVEAIAKECDCGKKEAKSFTPVVEARVVEVPETR